MRADVPDSVLEMLTIPGLRPEKVLKLHKELGIDTIDELEVAAKQDRLKGVKGLGPGATAQNSRWVGSEAKLTGCKAHPSRGRPSSDSQSKFRKFKPGFEIYHGRGRPSSRLRTRLRLGARCGEGSSRDVAAQVWRANRACSQPRSTRSCVAIRHWLREPSRPIAELLQRKKG